MTRMAVIFDMDGVLIDSYHAHMQAWMNLGRKVGRPITEAEFIPTFGRRNAEIFQALWDGVVAEGDIDSLANWKEEEYRRIIAADFPQMPGAGELIDALKAAGFALAVGSSGPPGNVRVALDGLGRAPLFDALVDGTQVSRGKPEPDVFLLAAKKLAIEPRACAVVEDSLAGLEAAARAGMTPIALTGTFERANLVGHADIVVESLTELTPQVIGELIGRRAR